jgi:4-oxalocrotonate tautomerase
MRRSQRKFDINLRPSGESAMPIIRLEMLAGRSPEQKSELAEALTRETARIAKCAPNDVQIVFAEVPPSSWAIGGAMVASRIAQPAAQKSTT